MNELSRADELVFVDPQSAKVALDSIRQNDLHGNGTRAKYDLLRTIVDDRLGNVHQSTDEILSARNHFVGAGASDSLLAIVHFYVGRVYQDLGDNEKALNEFLAARSHVKKNDHNSYWKGRIAYIIGYLYHHDDDFAHASDFLEEAVSHFKENGNELDLAHSYHLYGFNHSVLNNHDEALDALRKADTVYRKLNRESDFLGNAISISGVYLDLADAASAESALRTAYGEINDGIVPLDHTPRLSQIENAKGNHLKAAELLEEYLERSPDLPLSKRASFAYLISTYLEEAQQYVDAHRYMKTYVALADSLYADEVVAVLQEVEKRYEKQTLENEYRVYRKIALYRTLAGLLGLGSVIFFLARIVHKRKSKIEHLQADLEGMQSQMNEFDDLRKNLSEVLNEKDKKETRLRDVLTHKMWHIQKIVDYLFLYENNPDQFQNKVSSAIIQAEKDSYFGELQEVVNEKYSGIVDYLKSQFPNLTDAELNLCSLICFGFSNNQIGILFGYTNPHSIFNKRHQLRKKMGLWPKYESLEAYLNQTINNLRDDGAHVRV